MINKNKDIQLLFIKVLKGATMEQMIQKPNPLTQYFRSFKIYIRLPSGTSYYNDDIIRFTDKGEIGIMPMTGKDEMSFKNPDSLLNGEALIEVLSSCVPALINPRALLANDIDALITAIRYATYNDALETDINCPKCGAENSFKLNLQGALDGMTELDPEYVVNLDTGLSVFVKPYAFPELLMSLHSQFEQNKLIRSIENVTLTDDARSALFSKSFKEIAVSKFKLLSSSIIKVVDESQNINVTDKKFIHDFLQNIDKKSVDKISDLIEEINNIGIKKTFTAKCEKCDHEWENDIDFNPVNFS